MPTKGAKSAKGEQKTMTDSDLAAIEAATKVYLAHGLITPKRVKKVIYGIKLGVPVPASIEKLAKTDEDEE